MLAMTFSSKPGDVKGDGRIVTHRNVQSRETFINFHFAPQVRPISELCCLAAHVRSHF